MKQYLFPCLFLFCFKVFSQCPQFYDFDGLLTDSPRWISCDGNNYILSLQSNNDIGNYTIDWGDGSPLQSGTNWNANSAITHTYNASVQNFTITINLPDVPCIVTGTLIMEEPSNASIQIPFGGVTAICAPGSIDFINSSTDVSENTIFTWFFNDGTPSEVYDFSNVGQTVSHLYAAGLGNNCSNHVTLTAENECNTLQGGPSTATFTPLRIWDSDEASIDASANLLCYPDTNVTFTNTTNRNCFNQGNISQRYDYWNFGDYWGLGYDSIIDWQPWPPSLPIDIHYPGSGNYEVMLVDSSFCGLDTAISIVTIVDPPIAGLAADKDTVCVGEPVTFQNLSTGPTNSYIWNLGNGVWWNQLWAGNITYVYNSPGTYTISLISQIVGACSDTAQVVVHVLDNPQVNFAVNNQFGCDSLNLQVTNNSSSDIVNWQWSFGNGNTSNAADPPTQNYDSAGIYTILLEVENDFGCTNSSSQQVSVYDSPVPDFIPTGACVNQTVNFTDLSQSNDPIVSWNWNFGNNISSTLQNPSVSFTEAGTFEAFLSVSTNFCQATDTIQFEIDSLPTADFITSSISGCTPLELLLTNTSSSNATNFQWDFGDNYYSNLETPIHVFNNNLTIDTNYNITLVASTNSGCLDTAHLEISVFPSPSANYTNNAVPDCAPIGVDFTNTTLNATEYFWDFGDGNTDTSFHASHTFENQGLVLEVYEISLIVTNMYGCEDTSNQSIVVYPEPLFDFTAIPDSGCAPLEVMFPSVNGAVMYDWDFGDGNTSTISSPTHTFMNNTSNSIDYNVQLIASSSFGCSDTNSQTVIVFPTPVADFTTSDTASCSDLQLTISNNSQNSNQFVWDFDDGNIVNNNSSSFNYGFTNNGFSVVNHQIVLNASNSYNCVDSTTKMVTVYPNVIVNFQSDTSGCSPLPIDFLNTSVGASDFIWHFDNGDSSISTNPSQLFENLSSNQQILDVQLIATSSFGCADTNTQAVYVFPTPLADFTVTPLTQTLPNSTVTFNNNSNTGNWNYQWDFGDNETSSLENPLNHSYDSHGDFPIRLIVSSQHCSDSLTQWISILPLLPIANFQGQEQGCSPLSVQFVNLSLNASEYSWDFGDGTYSVQENPLKEYTEQGIYSVSLTAINNNGIHSIVHEDVIEVFQSPTSYFTVNTPTINVPDLALETSNLSKMQHTTCGILEILQRPMK